MHSNMADTWPAWTTWPVDPLATNPKQTKLIANTGGYQKETIKCHLRRGDDQAYCMVSCRYIYNERLRAVLCGVFVHLHLALYSAGGHFLPSLSINPYLH
jgi:hypothetical protein